MNIGETDGAIMSDVKPVGFVQKTKLERLVSGYSVVAALYKDNFADEVPIYSQKTITALQAEIEALRKDAERLDWLLPVVTGSDSAIANKRTIILAQCLMSGKDGVEAVDAALAKERS